MVFIFFLLWTTLTLNSGFTTESASYMATIFKSLFSFWQGHLSFLLVTHSIEFVGHFHVILVEKSFYGELEIGGGSNRVAIRSSGWAGSKCEPFFSASNHE